MSASVSRMKANVLKRQQFHKGEVHYHDNRTERFRSKRGRKAEVKEG